MFGNMDYSEKILKASELIGDGLHKPEDAEKIERLSGLSRRELNALAFGMNFAMNELAKALFRKDDPAELAVLAIKGCRAVAEVIFGGDGDE